MEPIIKTEMIPNFGESALDKVKSELRRYGYRLGAV